MDYPDLKVGDFIRVVNVPDNAIHRDTKRCFRKLIERGYSQRIGWIDEYGCPWIKVKFLVKSRTRQYWQWEHLAIYDDGSWVKVKRRNTA